MTRKERFIRLLHLLSALDQVLVIITKEKYESYDPNKLEKTIRTIVASGHSQIRDMVIARHIHQDVYEEIKDRISDKSLKLYDLEYENIINTLLNNHTYRENLISNIAVVVDLLSKENDENREEFILHILYGYMLGVDELDQDMFLIKLDDFRLAIEFFFKFKKEISTFDGYSRILLSKVSSQYEDIFDEFSAKLDQVAKSDTDDDTKRRDLTTILITMVLGRGQSHK